MYTLFVYNFFNKIIYERVNDSNDSKLKKSLNISTNMYLIMFPKKMYFIMCI